MSETDPQTVEDLPVLALTDEIAKALGSMTRWDASNTYRAALHVALNVSDEALVAEIRRRGHYVLGKPVKYPDLEDGAS